MSEAQPLTGLTPGAVAPHVFLCGDPARVERITAGWDEAREVTFVREYRVATGKKRGIPSVLPPRESAPRAPRSWWRSW